MPLIPETLKENYPSLPFSDPEEHFVVLHLAAKLDDLHLPIPIHDSQEKKTFIETLKKLATQLEEKYTKDINVRVFRLKLMPPGKIDDALDKVKRLVTAADYDLAFMVICKDQETGTKVQEDAAYKEIHDMFTKQESHDIVVAKNVRKSGDTHVHDQYDQGVYLFNYFYVEDTEFDFIPVWDHTGKWFVEHTSLDNSYLIKPVSGDTHFQYINHAYWHRLSEFLPQLIMKKTLKSYVLDNFTYNNAIAFPIIYEVIKR